MEGDSKLNLPNIGQFLEAAQRVQQQVAQIQSELGQKTVEGSAGGGMVKVTVSGRQQVMAVEIEKAIVDPKDVQMLQDLIMAATNQALARASELAKQEMSQIAGGLPLNLPGLL